MSRAGRACNEWGSGEVSQKGIAWVSKRRASGSFKGRRRAGQEDSISSQTWPRWPITQQERGFE